MSRFLTVLTMLMAVVLLSSCGDDEPATATSAEQPVGVEDVEPDPGDEEQLSEDQPAGDATGTLEAWCLGCMSEPDPLPAEPSPEEWKANREASLVALDAMAAVVPGEIAEPMEALVAREQRLVEHFKAHDWSLDAPFLPPEPGENQAIEDLMTFAEANC